MSLINDLQKEINEICRRVNWSIRWRSITRWFNNITNVMLLSFLGLCAMLPILIWLLIMYAVIHFIIKFWWYMDKEYIGKLLIGACFLTILVIFCPGCTPKTENDHDIIGEIVINENGKTCLNYELCNRWNHVICLN